MLGGWRMVAVDARQCPWFCIKLTPAEAPWLFEKGLAAQSMSTAAEILAVYAGMHAFGFLKKGELADQQGLAVGAAGTDNLSADHLSRRRLSSKAPVGLLVAQMNLNLWDSGLWLNTQWRPRQENQEADDLTNEKFSAFTEILRVKISYQDLHMDLFHKLRGSYSLHNGAPKFAGPAPNKRKRADKTTW